MLLIGIIISLIFVAAGLAMYGIAPKIGPNPWFGFRLGYTLINEEAWILSNKYAGKLMTFGGGVLLVIAIFLEGDVATNMPIFLVVMVIMLIIILVPSVIYAVRVAEETVRVVEEADQAKIEKIKMVTPMKPLELSQVYIIAPLIIYSIFIIISVMFYSQLPERMATHFDENGNPNGWMSRFDATLFMLGVGGLFFGLNLVFIILGRKIPMVFYRGVLSLQRSDLLKFSSTMMSFILGALILVQVDTIYYNLNETHPLPIWSTIFLFMIAITVPIIWLIRQIYRVRRKRITAPA